MTKPVTIPTTFGSNTSGTTTQLDNNFIALKTAINDLNTYGNFLTDTGAANAVAVSLPSQITGALTNGLPIQVKIAANNSGASVLNYNATGNANIVNLSGAALSGGELLANAIVLMQYSSAISGWILQTPATQNPTASRFTNSIAANVALNTANFMTGPTVAQGNTGTWFASGTITATDTAGAATIIVQLSDGNTVIDSAAGLVPTANSYAAISVSGYISNPAGNIRISVRDRSSNSGIMLANESTLAKDSTLSVFKIA